MSVITNTTTIMPKYKNALRPAMISTSGKKTFSGITWSCQ